MFHQKNQQNGSMFRKTLLTVGFTLFLFGSSVAQFYSTQYRPPSQNWQYLQTPHFKLVYAKGNDSTALQMGRILEEQYSSVQNLVGGELNNFPVVLNDYNDRSNGFVTPIHFRSEIELPPIKGKSLNPQTGNWLENVGPHELVHALQLSNLGDYNLPQLISLFSPDLARSFHGAIPFGVLEGIAVHHETENISRGGGRGNHPFFTNQFDATFNSDQRWSMGQLLQTTTDTRPFGRHYIGGYEFTAWLQNEQGSQTTRNALDFYMDFPFLGYGVALRHATGQWPGQLYNQFEEHHEKSSKSKEAETNRISELDIPFKGIEIRRPKWLSDSTLIFYGSFYNARPGFYSYDLENKNVNRLITTNTVGDYRYDLSPDRSQMVFSYYETDPIYDNTTKAELVQFDLDTHHSKQISKGGRLYAPAYFGDQFLALQTQPASSQLVSVAQANTSGSDINHLLTLDGHEIKAVATNPENQKLALIANKRGMQGLWITHKKELHSKIEGPPDVVFEDGSVFDPEWHPDGNKLMFSSDFSGTHQLYEYNLVDKEIAQITNADFNAFEGSYSPQGDRIAFVRQHENERLPAILNRADFVNSQIDDDTWQPSQAKNKFMERPVVADSTVVQSKEWETGDYSAGPAWLAPRTILPVFDEISNRDVYKAGFALHSNSLLADQRYSAEFSYLQNRGWYDLSYQNKTFYPGFKMRLFSRPSFISIQGENNNQSITLLRQERGLALSVPFQYRINQNIYSTSFFFEPEIRQSQIRFHDISATGATSNFGDITVANLFGRFNYRLQQNIRDLQPNSGAYIYTELERYLSAGNAELPIGDQQLQFNFQQPTALHGGFFTFVSPFRRWNQSLRLGVRGITQSGFIFDNQFIVSDGFSEPVLENSNNLLSLSTRYTIPLMYVDDGGFLVPLYLSNIYLVAFSNTVTDPTFANHIDGSRSVFGLGIRARFRLSNLSLDIGVGYGYEPSRQHHQFFIGDF